MEIGDSRIGYVFILGWFSNRTGTSFDDWKARGKDYTRLPVPNLPFCHWSSQLFDLRAPSSTDVPVLLLNQPTIAFRVGTESYTVLRERSLRACLHEGGGPQTGEVTCGRSPHLLCKCDQIKRRDYIDRRVTSPRQVTWPIWGLEWHVKSQHVRKI